MPDPFIGKTIGRYRIEGLIGRGGMGVVYRGTQTTLGRPVAVKLLLDEASHDEVFARRFRQEARAIASLAHENIVYVYDIADHEGHPYIVMEYLDGETLSARRGGAALPESEVRRVGIALARAPGHAHQHGVIHRDVKAANVMLTRDGKVKLTDFGIARVEGGLVRTATGTFPGTPAYMAPEQIREGTVSPRTDIYGLGILLDEMAAGRLPFDAADPIAAALARLREEPAPPRSIVPSIPEWLERVVLRAMASDPTTRYATAAELERDLVLAGGQAEESATVVRKPPAPAVAALPLPQREPPPVPRPAAGIARTMAEPAGPAVPPARPGGPTTAFGLDRRHLFVLLGAAALFVVAALAAALSLFSRPAPKPKPEAAGGGAAWGGGTAPGGTASSPSSAPVFPVPVSELLGPPATPTPRAQAVPANGGNGSEPGSSAERSDGESSPDGRPPLEEMHVYECRRGAEFNVSPEETLVTMDGKALGIADDWDGKGGGRTWTARNPGTHVVKLSLPGYRTRWLRIVVTKDAKDEIADVDTKLERSSSPSRR